MIAPVHPGPKTIGGIVIHQAAVLTTGTDHIGTALAHCEACGYQLYGIVRDWKAAYDLLHAELVSVIVVASREAWAPSIEYADRVTPAITAGGSANARWRERRARMMRRS